MGNNSPYLLKNVLVNEVIKEGPQIRTSVETGIKGPVFQDILFQPSSFLHMKFWKRFPQNTCLTLMISFTLALRKDYLSVSALLTHSFSRQIHWGREVAEVW